MKPRVSSLTAAARCSRSRSFRGAGMPLWAGGSGRAISSRSRGFRISSRAITGDITPSGSRWRACSAPARTVHTPAARAATPTQPQIFASLRNDAAGWLGVIAKSQKLLHAGTGADDVGIAPGVGEEPAIPRRQVPRQRRRGILLVVEQPLRERDLHVFDQ